ncbi:MAG: chloramphenicol phosphotransferase [Deltaproteobacteria bacterium]|nr:chloramphenicol phosphotransferase [Deltaproteobacteria bacterium]
MIIILNGTSSSGKTSIANELLKILPEYYFLFGVDQFLEKSMPRKINFENESDFNLILKSISGFNQSLKPIAQSVDHFILDHVLHKDEWIKEVALSLKGFETFFVGIQAPLDILEKRELERPNRKPGTARAQFEKINSLKYDLTVDTSILSPSKAAKTIQEDLKPGTMLWKNN